MDKYYYLIAQLPLLSFDSKNYISSDYFLEQAVKWLSFADFKILKKADIDDIYIKDSDRGIIRDYKSFEYKLRDNIVKFREGDLESITDKILKAILADTDPLKIELGIFYLRWSFVDQLESYHHFDLESAVLYFYKLQILDKISQFDKERGEELFDKISNISYEAIVYES
ncbi:MAG: DUF2764 family protein [Candidatus Kaelpia aquatica]|nr:DUF2764 family protein [Candidatus Kaelpia aquatica]